MRNAPSHGHLTNFMDLHGIRDSIAPVKMEVHKSDGDVFLRRVDIPSRAIKYFFLNGVPHLPTGSSVV